MSKTLIERRFEFDAAHRVLRHESKCANLHGHRYVLLLTLSAEGLDNLGRVVDFGLAKEVFGGWIDKHWDHNTILARSDPFLPAIEHEVLKLQNQASVSGRTFKMPWVMPFQSNPTAENLAYVFAGIAEGLIETHPALHLYSDLLAVEKVQLFETPNCSATWDQTQQPADNFAAPPEMLRF